MTRVAIIELVLKFDIKHNCSPGKAFDVKGHKIYNKCQCDMDYTTAFYRGFRCLKLLFICIFSIYKCLFFICIDYFSHFTFKKWSILFFVTLKGFFHAFFNHPQLYLRGGQRCSQFTMILMGCFELVRQGREQGGLHLPPPFPHIQTLSLGS